MTRAPIRRQDAAQAERKVSEDALNVKRLEKHQLMLDKVALGLGRIVVSHHRSSTSYQISQRDSVPLFLKQQCDRTLGGALGEPGGAGPGMHLIGRSVCPRDANSDGALDL